MSIEQGGPSEEEIIEAEKFNQMVDEGKLTTDEASQHKLPVYNRQLDLVWPKKMSYEEVKQYVAGREANKNQEKYR